MKNVKFLSLIALLSFGAFFLSNCTTEDDPDPSPVVNFLGGTDYLSEDATLAANTSFTVGITANHTVNIVSFKVVQSLDGTPSVDLVDSADFKTQNFTYDFEGTTGANAGTEIYEFIVADKDGNSTTKTITITNLGDSGKDLLSFTETNDNPPLPFRVYNIQGAEKGAFGITAGLSLGINDDDADKDIIDLTTADELPNWPAEWGSANGSTFKKVTSATYDQITNDAEIEAAWTASGSELTEITVADGDLIIIDLAGDNGFGLVSVTAVETTTGNNSDYVEFVFKKQELL